MSGSSSDTSECRSCGATLKWVKSRNDKNVPLDLPPVIVTLSDRGEPHDIEGFDADGNRIYGMTVDAETDGTTELYVCHFETCPNAEQHRRRGPAAARGSSSPRRAHGSRPSPTEAACPHCGAVIFLGASAPAEPAKEAQQDIPF